MIKYFSIEYCDAPFCIVQKLSHIAALVLAILLKIIVWHLLRYGPVVEVVIVYFHDIRRRMLRVVERVY